MKIDFNSLMILNAVVESGSVSVAAQRLAVSPSSVTYAINKLRKTTGNPLFTRTRTGVKPTTLAHELNQRYKKSVHLINEGLNSENQEGLSEAGKSITLSTYTFVEIWITLLLMSDKSNISQHLLNFLAHSETNEMRLMKLRNREVDVDLGAQLPNDPSIVSYRLFSSPLMAMVSKYHPTIKGTMNVQDWLENDHVSWNRIKTETSLMMGDAQIIDQMKDRRIHIRSDSSLNMMMLCANSGYIMLIPAYFSDFLENFLPVNCFNLPFENSMESSMYVHVHASSMKNRAVVSLLNTLRNNHASFFKKTSPYLTAGHNT